MARVQGCARYLVIHQPLAVAALEAMRDHGNPQGNASCTHLPDPELDAAEGILFCPLCAFASRQARAVDTHSSTPCESRRIQDIQARNLPGCVIVPTHFAQNKADHRRGPMGI